MNNASVLVLKNFSGEPEITPSAYALKKSAIALAVPIVKVENDHDQAAAVAALKELKAIRSGMESTRKLVKGPVIDLGRKIDSAAADFLQDSDREEMRLQGLINHYQKKVLDAQRAELLRLQREQAEALRLEEEAKRKREEAEKANDPKLKQEAAKLEEKALDASMATEVAASTAPIVVAKPKGLVVKSQLNFEITNAIVFCQSYPQFFHWNAETETLKLKRRDILDELNKEHGIFHMTRFPEELPPKQSQLVKPPGMRVFEQTKSHVR